MDGPVVSSPAASSLAKVSVIYQIGCVYLHAVFTASCLRNHRRFDETRARVCVNTSLFHSQT